MSSGCSDAFPDAQPALGYGLTETNAVGCGNFWDNYAAKPASTGRAQAPFVELAILGEGDAHLPAGERGEIAIRSAANIKGYWRNPEATAAAFTADGYVRTGDIGYLDEDGYLFIVDRKKDIIIRGGENISAAEVEAALLRLRRASPKRRCSGCPTSGSAKCRSRSSIAARAAASTRTSLRAFLDDAAGRVQDPGAHDLLRRAAAAPRHRQDRPGRAESSNTPAEPMTLPQVDRRTLLIGGGVGHRAGRRLRSPGRGA